MTNFKGIIEYRMTTPKGPSVIPESFGAATNKETFQKVALYIQKSIVQPSETFREISDEALVKLLQYALEDIQNHFVGDVSSLADTLGIFQISYDKDLFKPEERKEPQFQSLIRRAAAFVILNQVIFYLALAHNTGLVGNLKNLSSLDELQADFDHIANTIDYKAVFGAKVVSALPPEALDTINSLIENLEVLHFYNIKREILGKIYHNLIPRKIRKRIAAYYTSNTACELLSRLTIQKGTDIVLDPACGSGGFLVSTYNYRKELSPHLKHQEIINSIYGFDISLFASHLSVINLTLQNLKEVTDEVYVTVDDAFNQHPAETLELLWAPPSKKRVVTANGTKSKKPILPLVHAIIMNPPFTRIERLEDNYQDYLVGDKGILTKFAKYVKGQSGLHCFFLLHATGFLKTGGRLGAVLPVATFSSEYGEKIEPFILDNYRILYFITYESLSTFSVDCDFKEVLLVGIKGKKGAASNWKAKVVVLKEELRQDTVRPLANQLKAIEKDIETQKLRVRMIPKSEFAKEKNWMTFTRPQSLREFIGVLRRSKRILAQSKIVEFHEGFHLDAPNFFRLPNDYWRMASDGTLFVTIENEQTTKTLNIPKKYLIPSLDVPDSHRTIYGKMKNYILSIPQSEKEEDLSEDLLEYIKWGETFKKESDSQVALELYKIRNYVKTGGRWYTYGNHILVRNDPLTREKTQIGSHLAIVEKFRTKKRECITLYSDRKLTGSNSYFFGVVLRKHAMKGIKAKGDSLEETAEKEKLLAAWFSSSLFLTLYLYYRREISGDYGRIKIGDMTSFPCLNPSKLKRKEKDAILHEFDKISTIQLPTIYDQLREGRLRELDLAIMEGLKIKKPKDKLNQLYSDLIAELDRTESQEEEPSETEKDAEEENRAVRKVSKQVAMREKTRSLTSFM